MNTKLLDVLKNFDERGESADFVDIAIPGFYNLDLDLQLKTIFHAWKTAKLEDIRRMCEPKALKDNFNVVDQFLKCHEMRAQGKLREAYDILCALCEITDAEIVHYRRAAESVQFEHINKSIKLIQTVLPRLPLNRKRVLEFNLGVAANNASHFNLVLDVLSQLAQNTDELSLLFFNWLSGNYNSQIGEHAKSLEHYLKATALAEVIPSRSTDVSIIAFSALAEAFWVGDVEKSKQAYAIISKTAKNQKSIVGSSRYALATALNDYLEGKLSSALKGFNLFYSEKTWKFEHIQGSFPYLWALVAFNKADRILEIIPRLEALRDEFGQSKESHDYTLLKIYASYLLNMISQDEAYKQIYDFCQRKSHSPEAFHFEWGSGILLLFQEDPFEKVKSVIHFKSYPIIQRTIVWILNQDPALGSAYFWDHIRQQTNDAVTKVFCQYRSAQINNDILAFSQSVKSIQELGALSWLSSLKADFSSYDYNLATDILSSKFIADFKTHRIISLNGYETLDNQPQLGELFLSLSRNKDGVDKEQIALDCGYKSYDPLQHDPIIYNLISRLRDWIKKQDAQMQILRTQDGWCFSNPELVLVVGIKKALPVQALVPVQAAPTRIQIQLPTSKLLPYDLHPRQAWIYEQLTRKEYITRNDLLKNFQIQKSTAANDFNLLIEKGLITRMGSGRGIYYRLKEAAK